MLTVDIALKTRSPLFIPPPAAHGDEAQTDKWLRFEEACSIESTVWDPPVLMLAKELKMKQECVSPGSARHRKAVLAPPRCSAFAHDG